MSAPPITYTQTRTMSWISLLDQEELSRASIKTIEYEFTSPGNRGIANTDTHEGGQRVFRGSPTRRGPYATEVVADGEMAWGASGLSWGGEELTWED